MKLGGWWRLWIVLTGLYAVLVFLILAFQFWPDASKIRHHPSFTYRMNPAAIDMLIRHSTMTSLEEMLVVADRSGNVPQAKKIAARIMERRAEKFVWDPTRLDMVNNHTYDVSGGISAPDALVIAEGYVKVLDEELLSVRIWAVFKAFLIWIIPALAICALGFLFRWIYRGFKNPG